VARHRSPVGRSALPPSPYAPMTSAEGERRGAHRSGITPLRRGATAVAVATGAFSLVGAGVPVVVQAADGAAPDAPELTPVAYTALPAPAQQQVVLADAPTLPALEPVAMTLETAATDGAALVKAAQLQEQAAAQQAAEAQRLADEQARAAEEAARATADDDEDQQVASLANNDNADCGIDTGQLGAVKSNVRSAAEFLGCTYDVETMHGVAGRAGTSDHPGGLAVDFMVDRATGDQLAECALKNQDALGIKYVIWEQQINHGSGWKGMEDRGGVTANHFDHVHISFESGAGNGEPISC
jgi:hypothetical protein